MTHRNHARAGVQTVDPDVVLESRLDSLERRLVDGYDRIDEAVLAGTDVTEWESFWIRLLREYEDVCREFDAAA